MRGLHREVFAAPECATNAGKGEANVVRRQGEALGKLVAVHVQPLRGYVQVDATCAVRDREARLRA